MGLDGWLGTSLGEPPVLLELGARHDLDHQPPQHKQLNPQL
jgi:hypothetical protein